jgi:hypothetical protein
VGAVRSTVLKAVVIEPSPDPSLEMLRSVPRMLQPLPTHAASATQEPPMEDKVRWIRHC